MENNIFEGRQAFNFYKSYYETSLLLDSENRAEFLDCILHYQFTGELKVPTLPMASLAFNGQIHSLKKQVNGFVQGKKTYPSGHPTQGKGKGKGKVNDKGEGKQVQVQVQGEVQEKEKEKEEDIPPVFSFYKSLISIGADQKLAKEWLEVRKKKKATNTETAFSGFVREMEKGRLGINDTLRICIEKSWSGMSAKWLNDVEIPNKENPRRRNPNLTMF